MTGKFANIGFYFSLNPRTGTVSNIFWDRSH